MSEHPTMKEVLYMELCRFFNSMDVHDAVELIDKWIKETPDVTGYCRT